MPAATEAAAAMLIVAVLSVGAAAFALTVKPLGALLVVKVTVPANPLERVMAAVAAALPPCATAAVRGLTPNEKLCAVLLKVAVMSGAAVTATVQVPVPVHPPPDQPPNALPADGAAVSVTLVPNGNAASQTLPQLTPAGLDVTVPAPVPARVILTCGRPT